MDQITGCLMNVMDGYWQLHLCKGSLVHDEMMLRLCKVRAPWVIFCAPAERKSFIYMLAKAEHAIYCFGALEAGLDDKEFPNFPDHSEFPMFVTWNKRGQLRGCIGTFHPTPLSTGLRDFALRSAFNDHRFHPISPDEFQHLECGISLLHNFQTDRKWDDWTIGRDGIQVAWQSAGRAHSATFLPEVALAQGWDHLETIHALFQKADQTFDEALLDDLQVSTYESSKVVLTHQDYAKHKNSRE